MISPEEMAEICLDNKDISSKGHNALFFKKAAVVVFDGLIIWRGDLNMSVAVERLKILAEAIGLPVAVIEDKQLKHIRKKKRHPGKFIGPTFWKEKRSWDSVNGLDPTLAVTYNKTCTTAKPSETTEKQIDLADEYLFY